MINRVVGTWAKLYGAEKPPAAKPVEVNPELIPLMEQFGEASKENTALKEQLTQLQSRLAAVEGSVPADVVD